jgi:hypothetical protein
MASAPPRTLVSLTAADIDVAAVLASVAAPEVRD